jgi:hypothetical protein
VNHAVKLGYLLNGPGHGEGVMHSLRCAIGASGRVSKKIRQETEKIVKRAAHELAHMLIIIIIVRVRKGPPARPRTEFSAVWIPL